MKTAITLVLLIMSVILLADKFISVVLSSLICHVKDEFVPKTHLLKVYVFLPSTLFEKNKQMK